MTRANGYFEAYVNERAFRLGPAERELVASVTTISRVVLPGSQVRWAGSQRKGTAIEGSDLDLCVEWATPVTEGNRRDLRSHLEEGLARPARVLSHAIRLPPEGSKPKVDIAFANAAFGSRPLPDTTLFHDRRARQATVRGLKLWSRGTGMPHMPGWVLEAIVVHLDPKAEAWAPLDLFLRVIGWLDERATPAAVESVLRPAAFPRWNPDWSLRLPGRLEAITNQARALRRRSPQPESWRATQDVERWLAG
jgi:predicted nucleotidyltransferase